MKKLMAFILALMLAATLAPAAMAEPVQEITFALQNEPDGIDPCVTNNSFASPFLNNVFEGLVTYDTMDGSLIPGNAESWTISEDGTVYTFKLREGLKWSDGTPLTAHDYVYTFQRILTPETVAKYLNMVTDYVVNAQEYYDGTATADELGVKALDDTTLEITLNAATPYYIDILTMWTFSPVNRATIEANGDRWTTSADTYVCNGPFKIAEINMGESIVLAKNPEYYDADKVMLEKVTFRYIADPSTALMAYESGEIDGTRTVPGSDIARLKAEDAGLVVTSAYGTVYYDINCAKAPFDNVLVRKAINLAIDRTSLIEDVAQTDAVPAYSFIAPGYVVDGVDFTDELGTFELSEYADPEAAQAALAEAGYPNGEGFPVVTLSYYTNENVKSIVEAIAEMLQTNLNITVNITNEDWAIYYENVLAGNYEIGAMGWSGDYLHPMTFLPLLKTGDVNNLTGYSNPEYDAIVEQVMVETDAAKAVELIKQADEIASADYPLLNLYYKSNMLLMKDYVVGYYLNPSDTLYLKTAQVLAH
ncbi:MAG: peptide ABC transporter substrate-binding protein [Clostridia bacterium]|nr:peptide ABC transporter substrate-binding protein [Clostridia bacterium]